MNHEADQAAHVRDLLREIAEHVDVAAGRVRISATFDQGSVTGKVRVVAFRVPPLAAGHGITVNSIPARLLEELAHILGVHELTAEYDVAGDGRKHLRWVDMACNADVT